MTLKETLMVKREVDCPGCAGTGFSQKTKSTCKICKGTGKVSADI